MDLFCGAGGTTTGCGLACETLREAGEDVELELTAINHWPIAVETHADNHPWAKHLCESVENIDPRKVVPGGKLDLLVASPPCTHFSVARGGRPVEDQMRSSAWHILWWLEVLDVDALLIENVPEFRSWGPIGRDGKPIKSQKGRIYRQFLRALRAMGYTVDDKVLNAADYGDATSRKRLFIMARKGRRPIRWPKQTHSRGGKAPGTRPWRRARDIIDWSRRGTSIFARKKPLSENTMRRIFEGIRRFAGKEVAAFFVMMYGTGGARSLDEPMPAATAQGNHIGLCEFTLSNHSGGAPRSVEEPLPTAVTKAGPQLVRAEFILGAGGAARQGEPRSVEEPLPTTLTSSRLAVARAEFVLPPEGVHRGNLPRSLEEPMQALTQRGGGHLVEAVAEFLVPQFGEAPGQRPRIHDVGEPLPATTSHGAGALVRAFLTQYNGNSGAKSVEDPLPAATTRDRFALVEMMLSQGWRGDITFRMLEPDELARGMGFPGGYRFRGTKAQIVKQIGNAVAVNIARALTLALLTNTEPVVLDLEDDQTAVPPRPQRRAVKRVQRAPRQQGGVLSVPRQQTLSPDAAEA